MIELRSRKLLTEPTDEMIKAGIRALLECDSRVDDAESIVVHIWEEMAKAAPKEDMK